MTTSNPVMQAKKTVGLYSLLLGSNAFSRLLQVFAILLNTRGVISPIELRMFGLILMSSPN
jgi:hypothetical protein